MIKEFDAQTARLTEKASRQINEDRARVKESIGDIFLPKIVTLLKEFRM
jgi:hypothetical protein